MCVFLDSSEFFFRCPTGHRMLNLVDMTMTQQQQQQQTLSLFTTKIPRHSRGEPKSDCSFEENSLTQSHTAKF